MCMCVCVCVFVRCVYPSVCVCVLCVGILDGVFLFDFWVIWNGDIAPKTPCVEGNSTIFHCLDDLAHRTIVLSGPEFAFSSGSYEYLQKDPQHGKQIENNKSYVQF